MNPRRRRHNRLARKKRRSALGWHHLPGVSYRYIRGPKYLAGYGDSYEIRLGPTRPVFPHGR